MANQYFVIMLKPYPLTCQSVVATPIETRARQLMDYACSPTEDEIWREVSALQRSAAFIGFCCCQLFRGLRDNSKAVSSRAVQQGKAICDDGLVVRVLGKLGTCRSHTWLAPIYNIIKMGYLLVLP